MLRSANDVSLLMSQISCGVNFSWDSNRDVISLKRSTEDQLPLSELKPAADWLFQLAT